MPKYPARKGVIVRLFALFVIAISIAARAQDTMTCDSYKDGDDSVTVCTSDDYKSVTRCNQDASHCTHTTRKLSEVEDSDENLRKFCTSGIDDDCDRLASRVDSRKKAGSTCDLDFLRARDPERCKKEGDELKLNEDVVSKYMERLEAKRTAKTLELCDKRVFDKDYCEAFKKKQAKPQSKELPK